MEGELVGRAEELGAGGGMLDSGGGAIEVGRLGLWREDVGEEDVANCALQGVSVCRQIAFWGTSTVKVTPARMTSKLKDCCVVRAAFSPTLNSLHRTAPVSFVTVTCLREGGGGGTLVVPVPVPVLWVACDGRLVENARGALVGGCNRERRSAGRRRRIASVGL